MSGVWYKLCPRCKKYIEKDNPQKGAVCLSCGWEEYAPLIFCHETGEYCKFASADNPDVKSLDPGLSQAEEQVEVKEIVRL